MKTMSREVNSAIAAALHAKMTGRSWKTKAQLLHDNLLLAHEVVRQARGAEIIEENLERLFLRAAQKKNN